MKGTAARDHCASRAVSRIPTRQPTPSTRARRILSRFWFIELPMLFCSASLPVYARIYGIFL
jgi:hypothetical protein